MTHDRQRGEARPNSLSLDPGHRKEKENVKVSFACFLPVLLKLFFKKKLKQNDCDLWIRNFEIDVTGNTSSTKQKSRRIESLVGCSSFARKRTPRSSPLSSSSASLTPTSAWEGGQREGVSGKRISDNPEGLHFSMSATRVWLEAKARLAT